MIYIMKNLKMLYIALIALVAGAFSACTADWEPGDMPSGPQVAFIGDKTVNKPHMEFNGEEGDDTRTLTLSRVNTKSRLEVFVRIDAEDEYKEWFKIKNRNVVIFPAGAQTAEMEITVDHTKFEKDKTYTVTFSIADPKQTSAYGFSSWTVDFSLNQWIEMKVTDPDAPTTGEPVYLKGKFRGLAVLDYLLGITSPAEIDVTISQHKDNPNLYKIHDPWIESLLYLFEGATADAVRASFECANPAPGLEIDCSDPKNVTIREQKMGVRDIYGVWEEGNPLGDGIIYADGGIIEDGVITFPKGNIAFTFEAFIDEGYKLEHFYGTYGGNQSGLFRVILPGCEAADYTLGGSYNGMEIAADNETIYAKVNFTYGDDVTGIRYLVVEGDIELDGTEEGSPIAEASKKLKEGTDENIQIIEDFAKGAGSVEVKLKLERGIYTIVAAAVKSNETEVYERGIVTIPFYYAGIGEPEITDCEIDVKWGSVTDIAPEVLAEYPDYTSLAYSFKGEGKHLKNIGYYMSDSKSVADLLEDFEGSKEDLVANAGIAFDWEFVKEVSLGERVGTFGGYYPGLDPDTEYTLIVVAKNVYGKSITKTLTARTKPEPPYYEELNGKLKIGDYKMECTNYSSDNIKYTSTNVFTLRNVPGKTNEFLIKNLAFKDGYEWYANYDDEKNTLTVPGMIRYLENAEVDNDEANLFAYALGWYDAERTYRYAIFAYPDGLPTEQEAKTDTGPITFTVDPETKQINGLATYDVLQAVAINSRENTSVMINQFTASGTTIVPYVESDGTTDGDGSGDNTGDNTTDGDGNGDNTGDSTDNPEITSVSFGQTVQVPFSSIKISKSVLSNNKVKSFTYTNLSKEVSGSSFRTVKPISVELQPLSNTIRFGGAKLNAKFR